MRMFSRAGGKAPPINANCIHLWPLAEANSIDSGKDIVGTADLTTVVAAPAVFPAPVGFTGRDFIGALSRLGNATPFAADAAVLGNMTIMGAFKMSSLFAANGVIWSFGEAGTGVVARVSVTAARQLRFGYTNAALGLTEVDLPKVLIPGRWYTFAITRSQTATATVTFHLEGGQAAQFTGLPLVKATSLNATYQIGSDVSPAFGVIWNGTISGIALYNTALSNAAIEDAMSGMRGLNYQTTIYHDVQVRDGSAPVTFVSLLALRRVDFVKSVSLNTDVDNKVSTATITLIREAGSMQLGRYNDNVLNRLPIAGTPGTTTYAPTAELLGLNRPIRVILDRRALGSEFAQDAGSINPHTFFEGTIDKVDWGSDGNEVKIECRDIGAQMMDCFIPVTSVRSTAGGTAVQTVMQGIITDAKGNVPPASYVNNWGLPNTGYYVGAFWDLTTPISPGWNIRQFRQQPMPLLQAINTLAEQIGWTIRSLFDQAAGFWRMHFYEPDRNQAFPNHVITDADVLSASEVALAIDDIRNEVWVAFAPNSTVPQPMVVPVIPSGTGTAAAGEFYYGAPGSYAPASTSQGEEDNRVVYRVKSSMLNATEEGQNSQTVYGVRRMMVAEASSSNVDTPAEAQRFGVAMLRDLQQPKISMNLRLAGLPELEIGDMLKVRANGQWFTTDQQMAVVAYGLEITKDGVWTTVQMRGRPTGGSSIHLDREARPGVAPVPTVDNEQGEMQAGMTSRQRRQVHQGLMQMSHQYMRTARQVTSARNPDFSMRTQGQRPPDSWEMSTGTWGTATSMVNNASESGRYAILMTSVTERMRSDWIPVQFSQGHIVEVRARQQLTSPNLATLFLGVEWYDRNRVLISSASNTGQGSALFDWITYQATFTAPATAAFARTVVGVFSKSAGPGGPGGFLLNWVNLVLPTYAFTARRSGPALALTDNIAIPNTVIFQTQEFQFGLLPASIPTTPYNVATGIFTCPRPGFWEFQSSLLLRASALGAPLMNSRAEMIYTPSGGGPLIVSGSSLVSQDSNAWHLLQSGVRQLGLGDTVFVQVFAEKAGAPVPQLLGGVGTYFSGRLIYLD